MLHSFLFQLVRSKISLVTYSMMKNDHHGVFSNIYPLLNAVFTIRNGKVSSVEWSSISEYIKVGIIDWKGGSVHWTSTYKEIWLSLFYSLNLHWVIPFHLNTICHTVEIQKLKNETIQMYLNFKFDYKWFLGDKLNNQNRIK